MSKYIFRIILFMVFLLSACSIRFSFTGSDKGEAKTAVVNYFTVSASLAKPTTGQVFTEAMKDIVQNQGKLTLVNKQGDLQFEGTINGYSVSPIALQSNDIANANRLTISVQVKFTNSKDLSKNFDQTFTRFADFEATKSLTSIEDELIKEITNQMVQDIFNRAFSNW